MRTEASGVTLQPNGKFSVAFVTYKGKPGDEYISSEVESAAVFVTEDDAYDGQQRALDYLESSGRFPNMCQPF